jgi:hypothetical protein
MDVGLVPKKVLWRIDKKGFTVPKSDMTLKGLSEWKMWVMSAKLDGLVSRKRRQLALDRAAAMRGFSVPKNGSKTRVFNGSDVKLLDQLFRWAAVGCFLEVFNFQMGVVSDGK